MAQKKVELKEALDFAKNNGYIFAVYEKRDDVYVLINECYLSDIEEHTEIIVKTGGFGTDFNRFMTADGMHCFQLHNNFNVPKTIPVPPEVQKTFPILS
jgi:hypothetical protein